MARKKKQEGQQKEIRLGEMTRTVRHDYEHEDVSKMGIEIAELSMKLKSLKEEKKRVERAFDVLVEKAREGYEMLEVQCEMFPGGEIKFVRRMDTGEVISEEPLTNGDRQTSMLEAAMEPGKECWRCKKSTGAEACPGTEDRAQCAFEAAGDEQENPRAFKAPEGDENAHLCSGCVYADNPGEHCPGEDEEGRLKEQVKLSEKNFVIYCPFSTSKEDAEKQGERPVDGESSEEEA